MIVGSHTVHIFNSIRCCQLFSKVVVPICIAVKSVREFLLLSIFTNTCYYRIFSFCQSYGYVMVSSCGLNLHSPGCWWLWVPFVFLLCEVLIQVFCSCFIWVVFFSLIYRSFYIYIFDCGWYGLQISSTLFFLFLFLKIVPWTEKFFILM